MNAESQITLDTPIRTALPNGDRLAGFIRAGGVTRAILLPPKAQREHPAAAWNTNCDRVAGAQSYFDGEANTKAMADAGSTIAKFAMERGLIIPARDELDVIFRAFKPTTDDNYGYRSGDNPSSLPPSYPHEDQVPAQCPVTEYQAGGPEALPDGWVWSSTQYAGDDASAWCQDFSYGNQNGSLKSHEFEVVLVRSVVIG
jgi:hypothetical protein